MLEPERRDIEDAPEIGKKLQLILQHPVKGEVRVMFPGHAESEVSVKFFARRDAVTVRCRSILDELLEAPLVFDHLQASIQ